MADSDDVWTAVEAQTHPLKIFDIAKQENRLVYTAAPMVRYSKLAFRQTVHEFGTDISWTPMILAKEFNRNQFARDSDFTLNTNPPHPPPPTIVQLASNSPLELSRAASLVAPFAAGVDLNCGCPQSWACSENLGASLCDKGPLVRDMIVATRERLRRDGWAMEMGEADKESPKGRSVSVKIRIHSDLRRTIDFIETVLGSAPRSQNVDWLTIHPRTRNTPSREPINLDALSLLTEKYGDRVPILVSGDVFALASLPFTSPRLMLPHSSSPNGKPSPIVRELDDEADPDSSGDTPIVSNSSPGVDTLATSRPNIPKLAGLMSARALLCNPALYAGYSACPWSAVSYFMNAVMRAPMPYKLTLHHVAEMCGPGMSADKSALLPKKERIEMGKCADMLELLDFLDEKAPGKVERWTRRQ